MTHPQTLLDALDPDTLAVLRRFRFDADTFGRLTARLRERGVDGMTNALPGTVEPPRADQLTPMAPPGSEEHRRLEALGLEAIRDGAFAAAVLNGGMATRFGGVVKGTVDALPGRSFLQLQAEHLATLGEQAGAAIPLLLMNSFATGEATEAHLDATDQLGLADGQIRTFTQTVAPRVTPDGALFRDASGQASLYGPGHGDFPGSMRDAGVVDWLADRGVRYVSLCNVDNLGARPDPVVLGHHIDAGLPVTVELVDKNPGDKGGAPARVDGHLEIVEDFRFPDGFDQDRIPVFNTNTFVFSLDALRRVHPLQWFTVVKQVEGQSVVQFERLVGQLTAFEDATFLQVPRSRFLPVKKPADLDALRPTLASIFGA